MISDWRIEYNPKPIPDRSHDWDFWHPDKVDIDSPYCGTAESHADAVRQIEEDFGDGWEDR